MPLAVPTYKLSKYLFQIVILAANSYDKFPAICIYNITASAPSVCTQQVTLHVLQEAMVVLIHTETCRTRGNDTQSPLTVSSVQSLSLIRSCSKLCN